MKASPSNSRSFLDGLLDRPWIFIILGFIVLVSVWVFFFIAASRNQPTIILERSSLLQDSCFLVCEGVSDAEPRPGRDPVKVS
ncbi:MAG: hypothetical protein LAT55_02700 [Opitutales bacterium]|nr:hypothetical protein [Opitutales bacterium]